MQKENCLIAQRVNFYVFNNCAHVICYQHRNISMKKILLFLAVIISLSATKLSAQNSEQMQQEWRTYLKDSVQLADPMIDSVMAVRAQYQPQMREIFMDQSASREDKQTKIQGLRTDMEARYKSAGLTDDQVLAIHKHEDWMRQQMMNRRNSGGQ